MRYSYEYKLKCVEMYRRGEWQETPEGKKTRAFHKMIRSWVRIGKNCSPEALRHKKRNCLERRKAGCATQDEKAAIIKELQGKVSFLQRRSGNGCG